MNWNLALQYIAYAFLVSVYGVFAWAGKAPVEGFIAILTGALAALGSAHVSASARKAAADASGATPPPAQPSAPTTVVNE